MPQTSRRVDNRGQATVELALLLPFVVLLLLCLVQVGLVVRDQVLLTHAAREAARAASLDNDIDTIERAAEQAGPLDADRLQVTLDGRDGPGSVVRATLTYDSPALPLIRSLLGEIRLHASAGMRVER